MKPCRAWPGTTSKVIIMACAMVGVKTDLTNSELAECIAIVAKFFRANNDEYKRAAQYFPAMKFRPAFLETVLSEGLDQVEGMCDYEEEQTLLRDMDRMHEAQLFVYGDELKDRDSLDLEIEDARD